MIATAIPHSSSPLKAADTNQRAEFAPDVMADFRFAIAASPASPFNPRRQNIHKSHVTPLISSELGAFKIFRCYPSSLSSIDQWTGVNRSIEEYVTACSGGLLSPTPRRPSSISRQQIVLVMQCTK